MTAVAFEQDWNHYRALLAVARGGTLAGAAEVLGTSISTVHRHLADLEADLETRLFERRGRRRVLTPAGEALAQRAARIEEEILGIERDVAGADRELSGTVMLTTTDTIANHLIGRYLPELRERYPGIHLHLLVDNRHYRLGRGEADIALRPGVKPREPDVVAKRVGEMYYSWYASPDYLARHGRPRRKKDLRRHDSIVVDASLANVIYGKLAAELTDPGRQVVRSASLHVQAMAVQRGAGVAALPCFMMDGLPGVERLFRPEPEATLWLLYHADLRHTARVRVIVDLLTEKLEADAPMLLGQ